MKILIVTMTAVLAASAQTYRGRTDAVAVDVLALDGNRPIGGLGPRDFALKDNGVLQQIGNVALQEVPFSMLLVLDTSGSMKGAPLRDLQDAARGAVAALRSDDRGAVITFAHALREAAAWTSDHATLNAAVGAVEAVGGTRLCDAAFAALMHADPEVGRRRLIVLFTDGNDTGSWLPSRVVLDTASRNDSVVYAVTTASLETRRGETRRLVHQPGLDLLPNIPVIDSVPFLDDFVARTGGDLLETSRSRLRQTFEHIVTEFRSRYVLNYVPANVAMTGWHTLEVKLVGRKGTVTARRGYQR
jgi:VWFA-related protein